MFLNTFPGFDKYNNVFKDEAFFFYYYNCFFISCVLFEVIQNLTFFSKTVKVSACYLIDLDQKKEIHRIMREKFSNLIE